MVYIFILFHSQDLKDFRVCKFSAAKTLQKKKNTSNAWQRDVKSELNN